MKTAIFFGLLLFSGLHAEMIGNVEFRPPSNNWALAQKVENDSGATYVFVPSRDAESSTQVFTAHSSQTQAKRLDGNTIKRSIQTIFPNEEVQVNVFSKDNNSIIYKWDTPTIHGLTRIFATDKGTSIITYQTLEDQHLHGEFLDHILKTLQDAKVVN